MTNKTANEIFAEISQERVYAIDILLGLIAEFKASGNLESETEVTVTEFEYLENYLQRRAKKLLTPPRTRKPKAAPDRVAPTANKATFKPDASQNPIQRTGRNRP